MASKLDIINQALIILGENVINDYSTPTGTALNEIYDSTREDLLQSSRWRFAVKKVALTEAVGSPVNEWDKHFTLPSDMLLLISTYPVSRYEIFEGKLLTNNSSVSVDYIFDPGEKEYPSYFIVALTRLLAANAALAVTNDKKMAEIMEHKSLTALASAQNKDAQGRPSTAIRRRPFIDVRS